MTRGPDGKGCVTSWDVRQCGQHRPPWRGREELGVVGRWEEMSGWNKISVSLLLGAPMTLPVSRSGLVSLR